MQIELVRPRRARVAGFGAASEADARASIAVLPSSVTGSTIFPRARGPRYLVAGRVDEQHLPGHPAPSRSCCSTRRLCCSTWPGSAMRKWRLRSASRLAQSRHDSTKLVSTCATSSGACGRRSIPCLPQHLSLTSTTSSSRCASSMCAACCPIRTPRSPATSSCFRSEAELSVCSASGLAPSRVKPSCSRSKASTFPGR
jgi:hypothetical protein